MSRALNIALRTAHIAAMGVLLGGHAFDVPEQRLMLTLWLTIGSGGLLGILEVGPSLLWFHQGRGLLVLLKLLLLCCVPYFWEHRLGILLGVVALASVGSHMPAQLRYYSLLYRRVIRCGSGPGSSLLAADQQNETDPGG